MVPGPDVPLGKRRPSASIFQRLGLVGRRGQATKDTQLDYRQRWPTVTTLVEQRSESRLSAADDDQAPKSTKVKALEAAAVPMQWLQGRLESVQDRLETKIDDAQAKGQRRPSTVPEAGGRGSPKPRKPGQSTHPYDTDIVPHPAADDGDSRATTVRRFETYIFADPRPEPRKTWRLRLGSLNKTSKVAVSDTARSSEEALVPGDCSDPPSVSPERACKCAKERRPTAYSGKPPSQPLQAAVRVPVTRKPELLSAPSAKSSPSSMSKRAKAKANRAESRTTPLSNATRTPDPPTSRRSSLPHDTPSSSPQPHGRLSSAKADLLHMFASRPTSAGSDMGGVTAGRVSLEHKTQSPQRTCSKAAAACVCMSPSLGTGGAVAAKDDMSPSLGGSTPKAGALRHVLEFMKMVPPS